MKLVARLFCGFVLGWLIYMIAMVLTVYDGILSLIFQPFMGALFSGIFVGVAYVVGLLLRLPKIREAWSFMGWWAILISVAAIAVLIFHPQLGLARDAVDPETKAKISIISPLAGILGYFFAIFPLVNLPSKEQQNQPLDTNALSRQ